MKCWLTLEWNNTIFDALSRNYSALVKQDDNGCFSDDQLPETLGAATLLLIDIESQSLVILIDSIVIETYPVSTSFNGAGCREHSGCTPLGWHRVADKIGGQQSVGTIFKGRRACGVAGTLSSNDDDDLITSRILWLSGLQPGLNSGGSVDSYSRYIYIHGTAQEQLIGQAVSHGCIRMLNSDVISLFGQVEETTLVYISHQLASLAIHE